MILVAYASKHGATQGIAEHIARRLTERGLSVEVRPAEGVVDIGVPDAVILGSAVYAGSWMQEAAEFARRFVDMLSAVPIWCVTGRYIGFMVAIIVGFKVKETIDRKVTVVVPAIPEPVVAGDSRAPP